jgi:6-phosphofructokinase 1
MMAAVHILVNTGGGDAPGLNAVIRAVVQAALQRGWRVSGIRRSYDGLLSDDPGGVVPLDRHAIRGIAHLGGTILGTTNKGDPFGYPCKRNGQVVLEDLSDRVVRRFRELGGDALVAIGGDGSLRIAQKLFEKGIPVVGVPKTIDNDLDCTSFTFGFDTAVMVATEAIDRLHSTAEAHQRVMVVEVMGRYAGWIALNAGVSGGADIILIPEIPYDMEKVCEKVRQREASGAGFSMVVVAEGARPKGGELAVKGKEVGKEVQLGGAAERVAREIQARTGKDTRSLVLGHLQRGGGPTHFDRLVALRFGAAAVRLVERGDFGKMVALVPPRVEGVPIADAISRMKTVSIHSDTVETARDLGICLGD